MKNKLRRRYLAMALTAILLFTQIFGNYSLYANAGKDTDEVTESTDGENVNEERADYYVANSISFSANQGRYGDSCPLMFTYAYDNFITNDPDVHVPTVYLKHRNEDDVHSYSPATTRRFKIDGTEDGLRYIMIPNVSEFIDEDGIIPDREYSIDYNIELADYIEYDQYRDSTVLWVDHRYTNHLNEIWGLYSSKDNSEKYIANRFTLALALADTAVEAWIDKVDTEEDEHLPITATVLNDDSESENCIKYVEVTGDDHDTKYYINPKIALTFNPYNIPSGEYAYYVKSGDVVTKCSRNIFINEDTAPFTSITIGTSLRSLGVYGYNGSPEGYDSSSEFLYVTVTGDITDPEAQWPVIKKGDTKFTSYVSVEKGFIPGEWIYKLKKLDNWKDLQDESAEKLQADPYWDSYYTMGVGDYYVSIEYKSATNFYGALWYGEPMEFTSLEDPAMMLIYFNGRKEGLEVFANSALTEVFNSTESKNVKMETRGRIRGNHADTEDGYVSVGTGTSKFDETGYAFFTIKDEAGNVYIPEIEDYGSSLYRFVATPGGDFEDFHHLAEYEIKLAESKFRENNFSNEILGISTKASVTVGNDIDGYEVIADDYIHINSFTNVDNANIVVRIFREGVLSKCLKEIKLNTANFTDGVYLFTKDDLAGLPVDDVYKVIVSSGYDFESGDGFIYKEGESAKPTPDPDPNPNPNPNPDPKDGDDDNNNPTPAPAPAADAPLHSISVVEGATAMNSAGKEVTSAKENETISISWTEKADYSFVKWDLTGATPKEPVSANTIFVMGKEDVIVSYEEKLKVDDQVLETLPADADRSAKVTALKFDSKKLTLQKGSKKEFKVNVKAADGAAPKIYYVTKNKDIVAVDENGNFYATGIGETEVTAYCGSRSATVKVAVVCYTESISILDSDANDVTETTMELKGGEKEFLTVSFNPYDSTDNRNISWKSDNTKAVKISKGIITAREVKKEETAKISATYKVTTADGKTEKKTATVTVKVKPVEVSGENGGDTAHKLTLSKKSLTVKYSEKDKKAVELTANIQAKSGDFAAVKVEAESTNNDVISVNKISDVTGSGKKGKATITLDPKAAGTAYIIVKTTAADGKTNVKRCKITINTPVTDIVIKSGTLKVDSSLKMELRKGTSGTIEAVIEPVGSTDMGKLKITGAGGVSVKNGVITAKKETKAGKPATIKVKCGKISKKIEVTIK